MEAKEIKKKLEGVLPDFNWKENSWNFRANIACARISIEDEKLLIPGLVKVRMVEHLSEENLLDDVNNFKEKLGLISEDLWNDEEIQLEDIDEGFLDSIIAGLRLWREGIDKLRKGKSDRDQLIIIHPDWDLEDFEKDFKFISKESEDCFGFRLGIMSTKDWDFSNDDLCRELNENSGECFAIGPEEGEGEYDYDEEGEDDDEDIEEKEYPEVIIDRELEEAYDELKEKYPNIIHITKIYETDFD